jgi:hypothetical protein
MCSNFFVLVFGSRRVKFERSDPGQNSFRIHNTDTLYSICSFVSEGKMGRRDGGGVGGGGKDTIQVFLMFNPQSIELTREPPRVSSALLFIGGNHIGATALHVLNLIGSLAYPSGDEGSNFLVQMISTCFRYAYRWRRGGRHPVVQPCTIFHI